MRTYTNALADVASAFPPTVMVAQEFKDRATGYAEVTETGTVPASADGEGRYRVLLDKGVISEAASCTVTVGGAARTNIPYGVAPAAGEVAVNTAGLPIVELNVADAGGALSVVFTPMGTAIAAEFLNRVQKEIAAVQTAVGGPVQLVTVGKENADYTTIQAAVDAVDALGDCSATKPYAIAIAPGIYSESVVVDVAYLTLIGVGGPEACVVRNDAETDTTMVGAVMVSESNVSIIGLGLRNLFTVTGGSEEATTALAIGALTSPPALANVLVRGCVITGNGRDALFARCSGSVTVEDCVINGFSHSPAFDTDDSGGGGSKSLAVIMRRCRITTTYAPIWTAPAATDTQTLDMSDCQVISTSGEAMLYTTGGGTETININNCFGSAGLNLYQTPAGHTGTTTINHFGVTVEADRVGALVGTVTLAARTQRGVIAASLSSLDGVVKMNSALLKSTVTGQIYARNSGDSADGFFKGSFFESTQTTGTAPLTVASTTKVTNLNSDLFDDLSSAAFVQHTLADAKGDLLAATGADAFARVAVGTEGQVLSSNAAASAGVAYIWVPRFVGAITADSTELVNGGSGTQYFDQTLTMPAGALRAGATLRYYAAGKFSTSATGRPQQFGMAGGADGTTSIITDTQPGVLASQTDKPWVFWGEVTCRTAGASGTYAAHSHVINYLAGPTASTYAWRVQGSINTTIAHLLRVFWNPQATSDAGHKATLEQFRVDVS